MTWEHSGATTTYVMWREEHLWDVGVLQRVKPSNVIDTEENVGREIKNCK
jgi:hypothetical protein